MLPYIVLAFTFIMVVCLIKAPHIALGIGVFAVLILSCIGLAVVVEQILISMG